MTDIDLFVSHATQDDKIVSQIHDQLEASGLNVWVDHEDGIKVGDNWSQAIHDAVHACQAGLFVMSHASVESDYCESEWQRILARGLILYIVMIDTLPLEKIPLRLGTIQYIDLTSNLDTGIDELITAVKGKKPLESAHSAKKVLSITGTFPRHHLDIPLIGRDTELAQIQKDLAADKRMLSILGFGGLGKTRLATEVAVTTPFRDGIVWHTISPYTTITDLTASIRDHLKLDDSYNDDAVWNTLAHKQVLIVLDNAEDCRDMPAYAQRINTLDLSGGSRVLMTSRYGWRDIRSKSLTLPFLDEASAITVFKEMLALENPAFSADDYLEDLVIAGRFHPRLMQYSVSWLNNYPADYVLEILQSLEGQDAQQILNDIVQKTVDRVREQEGGEIAISALQKLAICRGGFTFEAGRAIIDEVRSLALLKQWNLIDLNEGRYAIDPMVRKVVGIDETAYPAHFVYYYQLTLTHYKAQDYAGLDIESANLDVAFAWQLKHDVAEAFSFYIACADFLLNRGRLRGRMNWLQRINALLSDDANIKLQSAVNNSMGNAYQNLATIGNRKENLKLSIVAYQNALEYLTFSTAPLAYASTQNNLGAAYWILSSIEDHEENLRLAITSFQDALKYKSPFSAPREYAETHNNLGNAYFKLASIEYGKENLKLAVTTFQDALNYITPDTSPLTYANIQNSLGAAYWNLAEIRNHGQNLKLAITAFQDALKYRTPDSAPLEYAITQYNLGNAYFKLANIEYDKENLKLAITAFQDALKYRTPQNAPIEYVDTQNNLAIAYKKLAEVENREQNLTLAIEAYSKSIEIEATNGKHYWRGESYRLLGRYEEALADFNKALELDPDDMWTLEKRDEVETLLNRDD